MSNRQMQTNSGTLYNAQGTKVYLTDVISNIVGGGTLAPSTGIEESYTSWTNDGLVTMSLNDQTLSTNSPNTYILENTDNNRSFVLTSVTLKAHVDNNTNEGTSIITFKYGLGGTLTSGASIGSVIQYLYAGSFKPSLLTFSDATTYTPGLTTDIGKLQLKENVSWVTSSTDGVQERRYDLSQYPFTIVGGGKVGIEVSKTDKDANGTSSLIGLNFQGYYRY